MSLYSAAVLSQNPLLYWQLSDPAGSTIAHDSSPNQLDGTVGSALTLGSAPLCVGDGRTSLLLPGGAYATTKLVSSVQSAIIQPPTASVEFIVRLTALPAATVNLFTLGGIPGASYGIDLQLLTNGTFTAYLNANGTETVTSVTALVAGVATYIALTYDGITIRLFINGVQNVTSAYSGSLTAYDGSHGFSLGDLYSPHTVVPNANISDVAIYGTALSPASIERHSAIAFGAQTYAQAVLLAQPALYWPLGDAPGSTTVKDFGPNGLNGTVGSALTLGSTALVLGDATTSLSVPGGAYAANKQITSAVNAAIQPTNAFSCDCVISFSTLPTNSNYTEFVSNGYISGSSSALEWAVYSDGSLYATISSGTATIRSSVGVVVAGQQYHLALTYDRANLRLYINGIQAALTAATIAITGYTAKGFCVGDSYTVRVGEGAFTIGQVTLYTSTLSPATIASHAAIALGTNAVYPTPYQQAVLAAKPTLYWPLNDGIGASTVADWSPNGLTGTVGSAVTLGSTGLVGSDARTSATLPGGAYAATKHIASAQSILIQPSNFISIEFIGRMIAWPSANLNVLTCGQPAAGTTSGYYLSTTTAGVLVFGLSNSAISLTAATALTTGVNYHIAFTYDGATIRFYLNGTLNASVAYTSSITGYDNATGFILGDSYTGRTTSPNVITQDVAVYAGSVLSPQTIAQHYAVFQGGAYTPPAVITPAPYYSAVMQDTPVGFWPLDDALAATTITDLSGNNISGLWQSGVTRQAPSLLTSAVDPSTAFPAGSYAANKVLTMTTGPIASLQAVTSFSCDFLVKFSALPTAGNNSSLISNAFSMTSTGASILINVFSDGSVHSTLNVGAFQIASATGTITTATAYHIAATYNKATLNIYVNGVSVASGAYTAAIANYNATGATPFSIGDQYTVRTGEGAYTIGQVAFYSQALTPARVLAHYNSTQVHTLAIGSEARIGGYASISATAVVVTKASLSISANANILTPYSTAVRNTMPVLYWQMDELTGTTVGDGSGNGLIGTLGAALTLAQTGLCGSDSRTCMTSPGGIYSVSKLCTSAQNAILQPALLTLEFVGRLWALPSVPVYWISCGNSTTTAGGYGVQINPVGTLQFYINAGAVTVTSSIALQLLIDYHVVCTYDNANLKIYVDGVLCGTTAHTGAITGYDGVHGLVVGNTLAAASTSPNASIADVSVYNTALSAANVLQHSNISAGYFYTQYEKSIQASAPILFWPLGDTKNSDVHDFGPNKILGTLGSAVTTNAVQTALIPNDYTRSANLPGGADGPTKRITGSAIALQPTAAVTIECLYEPFALPTAPTALVSVGNTTQNGYALVLNPDGTFVLDGLHFSGIANSSASITTGKVHHLSVSYDSVAGIVFYMIDGSHVASATLSGPITYPASPTLTVGESGAKSTTSPNGQISGLAIYAAALDVTTLNIHAMISTGQCLQIGAEAWIHPWMAIGSKASILSHATPSISSEAVVASHISIDSKAAIAARVVKTVNSAATVLNFTEVGINSEMVVINTITTFLHSEARITFRVTKAIRSEAVASVKIVVPLGSEAYIVRAVSRHLDAQADVIATGSVSVDSLADVQGQVTGSLNSEATIRTIINLIRVISSEAEIISTVTTGIDSAADVVVTPIKAIESKAVISKPVKVTLESEGQVGNTISLDISSEGFTTGKQIVTLQSEGDVIATGYKRIGAEASTSILPTAVINSEAWLITQGHNVIYSEAVLTSTPAPNTLFSSARVYAHSKKTISGEAIVRHFATPSINSFATTAEKLRTSISAYGNISTVVNDHSTRLNAEAQINVILTQTLNSEALIYANATTAIDSAGVLQSTLLQTLEAEAKVSITTTQVITAEGLLEANLLGELDSEALLTAQILSTLEVEADVQATTTDSITSESVLSVTVLDSIDSEASTQATTDTACDNEACTSAVVEVPISAEADITAGSLITIDGSATIIAQTNTAISAEAYIVRHGVLSIPSYGWVIANALCSIGAEAFTLNAIMGVQQTLENAGTVITSGMVTLEGSGTVRTRGYEYLGAQADISKPVIGGLEAEALLTGTITPALNSEALIFKSRIAILNSRASIASKSTTSIGSTAQIISTVTKTITGAGTVGISPAHTIGSSAYITQGGTMSLNSQAGIAAKITQGIGAIGNIAIPARSQAYINSQASIAYTPIVPGPNLICFIAYESGGVLKSVLYTTISGAQADCAAMNNAVKNGMPVVIEGNLADQNFGKFTVTLATFGG